MSDLSDYIKERVERDPEFAEGLETGYRDVKLGVLLRRDGPPKRSIPPPPPAS